MKPGVQGWLGFGSDQARGANLLLPLQQCHVRLFSAFPPSCSFLPRSARPCRFSRRGRGTCRRGAAPEGSRAGELQHQPQAATLAALPFLCLQRRMGPEGESSRGRGTAAPDLLSGSLGRVCAYRISILAVPLGINYAFRTRGYSNVKIVYLQLGELKTEAEKRAAPLRRGRPPASLSSAGCSSPSAGRDGSGRLCLGISVLGRTRCSPAPAALFPPRFPGETGADCLAAESWW